MPLTLFENALLKPITIQPVTAKHVETDAISQIIKVVIKLPF